LLSRGFSPDPFERGLPAHAFSSFNTRARTITHVHTAQHDKLSLSISLSRSTIHEEEDRWTALSLSSWALKALWSSSSSASRLAT